ncbi:MAG TPA: M20/M25/M40 family metallo-hydrolase [Terriglobales bacterium]|nr:M20/M25/M40 family metallo-hydrolase [Terriglobales bacterium]
MQSYPVELLQEMLKTYSPSGSETQLSHLLHGHAQSHGLSSRIDKVGNLICETGDRGPRVLLCGHMDTVSGEIPVRREGDLLFGRGAVDAKSSLAAMFVGAIQAHERSLPVHITVAGMVEEETTSRGVRELIRGNEHYDLAVFGEPSGVSNLILGYKGSVRLHVSFETTTGHSASPWLYKSSYDESFKFWTKFEKELLNNNSESKFTSITGCVTGSQAGDSTNTVPASASLDIDVRIPPGITVGEMTGRIRQLVEDYENHNPEVSVSIASKDESAPFLARDNSQVVSAFRWAIRNYLERPVAFVRKTGTSDINLFARTQDAPMLAYGPGDSSLDHTDDEHVSITEYLNSIEIYSAVLARFAELSKVAQAPIG